MPEPRPKTSLVQSGGWPFLISGMIGRLPAATLQLGLLMYITASGLGFALGGLTVAAVGLGTAAGAPIVGRLVDRFGPFPVVAITLVVQTVGILAVLAVVQWAPLPVLVLAAAALVGAANPQVGPICRAHWSTLARQRNQPDLVRVALGYEGACDEIGFVLGPAMASVLVGLLGPNPALWALLAFTWVGEGVFLLFLWHRRAERAQIVQHAGGNQPGRLEPGLLIWPLLACGSVGMVFGSTQTAVTAVHTSAGHAALSGIIYAFVGVGSAIMSVLIVRVAAPLGLRIAMGGLVVAGASVVMTMISAPVAHGVVAVVVGMGVGAVLVSGFARVEQCSPASRINQAMTFGATFLTLGISVGAGAAGPLSGADPAHGFWPAIAAGALAMLVGAVMLGQRRRPLPVVPETTGS